MTYLLHFLAAVTFVILFLVWVFVMSQHAAEHYEKRFPPISDEEFLAQCPPGTNRKMALRVRQIVAENLGVKYECIYPSTNFAEDLGVD